ncbi:efflux RND transporter periplasmic adaptor subunit [Chelatococcus sp. GCM10030263]|uniref:HlyD family secretion protein n=1 Tax=Chelatococcus sp. GCM10030263 TaxID=3273387 RepID=UPI003613FBE2
MDDRTVNPRSARPPVEPATASDAAEQLQARGEAKRPAQDPAQEPAQQPKPEQEARRETQPAAGQPAPKRSRLRLVLFLLLPVILVAGGYLYVTGGQIMSTENAYVQADIVGISTDVAGIVSEVDVRDNQRVKAGDVLFKLDDLPFRLALDRANAQIGLVKNDLEALKASYAAMQSQIAQAKTDIAYYQTVFKRQQELAAKSVSSQASYDQAKHDLDTARLKLDLLQNQLAGIAANLNGDPNAPVEDHPRYKDAVATRDEAARQLAHTVVKAPMDGIVTNVPSLQKGQYLAEATNAFSLVSTDHVWVEANPKETELTWVKPGQHATVSVDTYPGEAWTGTIESISPASASSFSLLPAENTSGNWVKVVQRIAMRVKIETPPDKPQLRAGMSVVLGVDTGHARGLPTFVTDLFGRTEAGNG